MAKLTIRAFDESTRHKLRVRAALRLRSIEAEASQILYDVLDGSEQSDVDLAARIVGRFQPIGGVDLPVAQREPMREPPQPTRRARRE